MTGLASSLFTALVISSHLCWREILCEIQVPNFNCKYEKLRYPRNMRGYVRKNSATNKHKHVTRLVTTLCKAPLEQSQVIWSVVDKR